MLINDILKNPWDIFNDIDEETKQEFELSNILVDIACKIINYRLDNDMTQKDLADKLDITQAMVSKLESGEYITSITSLSGMPPINLPMVNIYAMKKYKDNSKVNI